MNYGCYYLNYRCDPEIQAFCQKAFIHCLFSSLNRKIIPLKQSSMHIATFRMLGTRILPLLRNIPPARKFSWSMGREREKMRK